ncbi:MAG: HAMP domain-containing protein [Nitrospiria bacterium]
MRRFGLRYQLTWWFLLIGVVPAVGGSAYTYTVTRQSLFREAASVMNGEAAAMADRLDEALRIAQAQLVLASKQISLTPVVGVSGDEIRRAGSLLAVWGRYAPIALDAWAVIDEQGQLQSLVVDGRRTEGAISDAERALAAAARNAPQDVVFGGVVLSSRTGRPALAYAASILGSDGAIRGALYGEVPVESLRRAMGTSTVGGATYWVMDAEQHVVLTTDPAGSAGSPAPPFVVDPPRVERESRDAVAVAARPLRVSQAGPMWTVAVAVPKAVIDAKAGIGRYVALILVVAAAVVFLAYLVSTRITRPIRQLEEGTRRIAQGDLDLELKIKARNELEQLAQSFHQMAYELKRAQERLIKTERLAAIGEVSLAIHHEINNPLTSVMGFAEMLQQRSDLPPEVREHLVPIYEGALRMRDIIKKLERVQDRTTDRFQVAKMTDLAGPGPDRDEGDRT